jgi:hypothetical protein
MIKLLHFSGPCSFATFVATLGEAHLNALVLVHSFDRGNVVCLLDMSRLDEPGRVSLQESIAKAHSVEPVTHEHDVAMSARALEILAVIWPTTHKTVS